MLKTNPMFYVTAKIWKAMAVLYQDRSTKWRIYAILVPYCMFHSLQYINIVGMEIEVTEFTINLMHIAIIFNGLVRTIYTVVNRHRFEVFVLEADSMYNDIELANITALKSYIPVKTVDKFLHFVVQIWNYSDIKFSVFSLNESPKFPCAYWNCSLYTYNRKYGHSPGPISFCLAQLFIAPQIISVALIFLFNFITFKFLNLKQSNDEYAIRKLKENTVFLHKLSIFNVALSAFNVFGGLTYPWLCGRRIHPVAISVPGVDLLASPTYEIVYALQCFVPFFFMATYAPFLNFIIIFALLCKTGLLYLQSQIIEICKDGRTEEEELFALNKCIIYYNQLHRYTETFNSLVTYVTFFELVVFSSVICGLLFSLASTERILENLCNIVYICSTLFALFTTYWFANEIVTESIKVSEVAYSIPWFNKKKVFCKTLLCFMIRTQKPLQLMVGNLLPMNLATYQRLLNASYTYFNLVWSFYNQ